MQSFQRMYSAKTVRKIKATLTYVVDTAKLDCGLFTVKVLHLSLNLETNQSTSAEQSTTAGNHRRMCCRIDAASLAGFDQSTSVRAGSLTVRS
jgi:hypothetical protein